MTLKFWKKNACMFLLTDMFILCVKNPELQPFAVYSCKGLRWTQVAAFVVSLYSNKHCGSTFRNMFHTLLPRPAYFSFFLWVSLGLSMETTYHWYQKEPSKICPHCPTCEWQIHTHICFCHWGFNILHLEEKWGKSSISHDTKGQCLLIGDKKNRKCFEALLYLSYINLFFF